MDSPEQEKKIYKEGRCKLINFVYGKKKIIWNSGLNFLWKFYMVSLVLN